MTPGHQHSNERPKYVTDMRPASMQLLPTHGDRAATTYHMVTSRKMCTKCAAEHQGTPESRFLPVERLAGSFALPAKDIHNRNGKRI